MDEQVPGYALRDAIARGATSTVWRAEQTGRPGRVLAVKHVRTDLDRRAIVDVTREADALGRLAHPHVLRLLDVVTTDDGVALVTPYAAGGSLAARLARAPRGLPPAFAAEVGARIASALAAAHDAGLVHRDVKPANVLFDADGVAMLGDFGTARVRGTATEVVGTGEYLDPATAVDGRPPDALTDVYALGVALYEALTGSPPYAGVTPQHTVAAADQGLHVPLQERIEAPATLTDAVNAALARDPRRRPRSAGDLAGALDEARRELERAAMDAGVVGSALGEADGHDHGREPIDRAEPTDGGQPTAGREPTGDREPAQDPEPGDGGPSPASDPDGRQPAPSASEPQPPTPPPTAAEPVGVPDLPPVPATPAADGGRSATQLFGPAPPSAADHRGEATRRIPRPLLLTAAALVLLVPIVVALWLTLGDGSPDTEQVAAGNGEVVDDTTTERQPAEPCEQVEDPDADAILADVEGRGCSVPVSWDGAQLVVPMADGTERRFDLGADAGDELLFGDWTCDGHETPALYRPSTGEVFTFEALVEPGEETTVDGEDTGVAEGEAVVTTDGGGCDRIDVSDG